MGSVPEYVSLSSGVLDNSPDSKEVAADPTDPLRLSRSKVNVLIML
jgi:hypothetical protein